MNSELPEDNISPHAELSKEDKNIATINFLSELWDIVAHDNQWRDEELRKSLCNIFLT